VDRVGLSVPAVRDVMSVWPVLETVAALVFAGFLLWRFTR
jgi:hypothetical protein